MTLEFDPTHKLSQLAIAFAALSPRGRQTVVDTAVSVGYEFVGYVKVNKLQGQVLHHRSGNLSTRVTSQVTEAPTEVRVRGGVFSGVPYAHKHEYGYKGPEEVRAHVRRITQAWGRPIAPTEVSVRPHTRQVNYPVRSYLRSSLSEQHPHYARQFLQALLNLFKRGGR